MHSRRRRRITVASIGMLSAGLVACRGDAPAREEKAGGADTAAWSLAEPATRVGFAAGPGQELDRVYGAVLRADGSLVIGNSGTSELRFYDAGGQFLRAAGRSGAGPGEFGSINWLAALPGDSILAFDLRRQRFSVWSATGEFAREMRPMEPGPARPIGLLADGSILAVTEGQFDPRGGSGAVRDTMSVLRMDRDGRIQPLGRFPGAEWLVYAHPSSFRTTQLPFGRAGHVAALGDGFVYGSSESGRLIVHDASGRRIGTIDLGAVRRAVARAEIDGFLESIQDPAEKSALARHYGQGGDADGAVFTALHGGWDGHLWIRLAPAEGAARVKWLVLNPSGEQVGSAMLDAGWLPLQISPDRAVLRETDADGVQRVTVRRIVR